MDQSRPAAPAARPNAAPSATAPSAPAKAKSSTRTLILLGVLAFVIGCYAHDYFIAGPKASKANDDVHKLVDARNARGVRDEAGKLVDSSDIQKELGREPSSTEEVNGTTVEVYRFWGGLMPHRQYLSVMYVGDPRHYQVHHLNHMPYDEDFPEETKPRLNSVDVPAAAADGDAAAPASDAKSTESEAPTSEPSTGPGADAAAPAAETSTPAADVPAAEEVEK